MISMGAHDQIAYLRGHAHTPVRYQEIFPTLLKLSGGRGGGFDCSPDPLYVNRMMEIIVKAPPSFTNKIIYVPRAVSFTKTPFLSTSSHHLLPPMLVNLKSQEVRTCILSRLVNFPRGLIKYLSIHLSYLFRYRST